MKPTTMEAPIQLSGDVQSAVQPLTALFDERDLVLFRPIETWMEAGRQRSRVDYRNVCYRNAKTAALQHTVEYLIHSSVNERTNLFFGVCPRVGNKGRFDLAWQIRSVRALWADIDHCSVGESLARCDERKLPQPSAVVNSGHGVHLYWLLAEPYLIDDMGDPLPVETEWTQTPDGRKEPRRFIVQEGDRLYLDQRQHISQISPKARRIQDLLAGIAQAIGGDHTTDLARLLRLPGTLNRKDERNGREPLATALVECDPLRRYLLTEFDAFVTASPASELQRQIAAMPLPAPRRVSPSKADKLAELIAASAIAPASNRSEADFAVCCYAIRNGIAKEEVWSQLEQVGKFAEQGRRYFDVTWTSAEFDVRAATCAKLQRRSPATAPLKDFSEMTDANVAVQVDARSTPVAVTMGQITDQLLTAGHCFNRVGQLVVVRDQEISPVLTSSELAGLLNEYAEFYFVDDNGGEFKPLPPAYGNTWLNHAGERRRLPAIKLFTHNPVYTLDWRLVAPGFDPRSGIYYAGPIIEPRPGTDHLDTLLRDFCWKTPADRTNYLGILLTCLLVSRFIGSKPAALFNGNQPELGKSVLAQVLAILRDGQPVETATYNANDEEFEKRLGTIVRRGLTTIIIDNAKARGRNPRIDSACLERSITDPILSFRLLGFSQEIRAENSHQFCITADTPEVSRDLITRCMVINLYHEGDPRRRTFDIADPEGYAQQHRLELLGELVSMVECWKAAGMPRANVDIQFNKKGWGNIVGGILETCGEPDFLTNADEAASALDETRREFTELVGMLVEHPQGVWTAAELTDFAADHFLLRTELGDGSRRSQTTRMGVLAGRYVDEQFNLGNERSAIFRRSDEGRKTLYSAGVVENGADVQTFADLNKSKRLQCLSAI